jgi:hypothetical protein
VPVVSVAHAVDAIRLATSASAILMCVFMY